VLVDGVDDKLRGVSVCFASMDSRVENRVSSVGTASDADDSLVVVCFELRYLQKLQVSFFRVCSSFSLDYSTLLRNLDKDPSHTEEVPFKNYFFAVLCVAITVAGILVSAIYYHIPVLDYGTWIVICLFFVVTLSASCVKVLLMSKNSSFSQNASFKQLKER
jgi:hypothetical protein